MPFAKRMLQVHSELCGYEYVCPTNVYGPHDNFDLETSHVIPALIHKCFLAKKNNCVFKVKGTGKPLRQFVFSEDLAKYIVGVVEGELPGNVIVADSREYSIRKVVQKICDIMDFRHVDFEGNPRDDGQYKKTVMGTPNFEFTNLETGLEKTIEWFLLNSSSFDSKNVLPI